MVNCMEKAEALQNLIDIEEIKQLKARYCYACDENNPEILAGLLAEDAVWELDISDRFEGRQAIVDGLKDTWGKAPFTCHIVTNPFIEVRSDHAVGRWYLVEPITLKDENQAVIGAGRYDEKYIRADGEWKFQEIYLKSFFWTPYEDGWAKKPFFN